MLTKYLTLGRRFYEAIRKPNAYRRVYIIGDGAGWALDYEAQKLRETAERLGIKAVVTTDYGQASGQCAYFTSQFVLRKREKIVNAPYRIAIDYFHGQFDEQPEFQEIFGNLVQTHAHISRIRVAHSMMEQFVLSSGIDPSKVFRIPIGIDTDEFAPVDLAEKRLIRNELGLPEDALIVGSFQKDGNGWDEGLEPKLIKGPDILLRVLRRLKDTVNNLHVLLTGPARGYVKRGLTESGIPFTHRFLTDRAEVSRYFRALDLYLVTSREEGGPKAILEAMASGVPLVTTRVGQAVDLVEHGENGWMVAPEDAEGLARYAEVALMGQAEMSSIMNAGRSTAVQNSYRAQLPLWENFFRDYIRF